MFKRVKNYPLYIIFCIVLLDLLGFGIIIPILPLLFTDATSRFSLLSSSLSQQHAYILFGLLVATYPLAQFIAAPILGQLSDRYGRRPILILSLIGTALSYALFGVGLLLKHISLLFFARALDGLTGGNISVAQAVVGDIAEPHEKTKHFGILGAGFGIGLVLGPYLGGKLSDPTIAPWFGADVPFWVACVLGSLNALTVYFFLPETIKTRVKHRLNWFESIKNVTQAYTISSLRGLFTTGFLYQLGFSFFTSFVSVFLYHKYGFNQGSIGEYFAFAGISIALTQAFITPLTKRYLSDITITKWTLFGSAFWIFMFFLVKGNWQLLLITFLFAVCNGLSQTSFLSIMSSQAEDHNQGKILGMNASIYAMGQAFAPLLSGFIAASVNASTPIFIAGVSILLSSITFLLTVKNAKIRTHLLQ